NGQATSFSVYNSILWNSSSGATDFAGVLDSGTTVSLVNDVFQSHFITGANVVVQNQINAAPGWIDPLNNNYRLQTNPLSPAINSGTLFSPGGEPATDIEGHARIIGSVPDRGAYESVITDQTTFIVSNTLDSGAGSLRDAITLANGSLSPPKLIKFDIRNQANVPICPAVISLTAILPTIVGRMTIDGSTQPTSTVNTDPTAFNANLCIVIKPASGTLSSGFTVPANSFASLSLRGLAIGGFSQPVRILGGQGSLIAGNQFGGNAGAIALPGADFNAITIGSNASGALSIGGIALGDRNVIGDAANSGIDNSSNATTSFTTCQIVNNLIGLARDGHTQLANAFGINNAGSGCQIVGNRIAGNTITNVWLNGLGSTGNVIQQNFVGVTNINGGFFNSANGILVTGQGNIIGASGNGGSIAGNTVRFNGAGGIVVKGDSALGNSVNANLVYDNGASGTAMDIDLLPTNGAIGPTPNDPGDTDEGPNHLQNFPVLKGLVYSAAGSTNRPAIVSGVLNTQSGPHRIDLYFSSSANTSGKRGHAEVFLTQTTINVGNGPTAFSLPITVPTQLAGAVISATATDAAGNTSEVGTALSIDSIFVDGTE
ncbi:MAG: choice-of-anchor Q domain-containing protein, partial [Dokdonella sp.]